MATLQQIQEAARLKREKGLTPAQAVEEVRASATPPGTQAEAIGKVVNQVGGDVKSRQEARQLAESGLSAEEINNVRSRPNWGKKQEDPSLTQQQYATNPLSPPTQTQTGVNGETFQVAPTNPNTGLSQPTSPLATPINPVTANVTPPEATVASVVTPTPTPEVAPIPLDPNAEIKAKNEAQMALNKQKSDLAIQERKQQEADAKLASTPTDQKGVLNALVSGATVPTQNTAAYRNAQTQYKNYQKFSTMTPSQLVSNMKMGEIDTATSQLLANNPSYIQAKQEFEKFQKNQSINKMVQSVANGATGKVQEVDHGQEASDALAKKLGINETNADAYARIVSKNPEVVQLTQTVSSITKQLNTLNTERNAVYADLKKQYPDLSASGIMTLMSSRTKQATDQIDALNSSLSLTTADLKTAMEMAKGEYEATSADITLQSDIAKEQRQIDNALALNQAEYDQKIAQQAQALADPQTQIDQTIQEFAKLGITAQGNTASKLAEFKKSGLSLPDYITQLRGQFMSKPEYQAYRDKQSGTEWQSTSITRYNPSTGANESTPIFYRKKTSGGFEAVDLSGNPIDVSSISGGSGTPASGTLPSSFTGDTTSYIASKEGFRDTAYQDSGGVWTIGYGTTKINGKPVQKGQKITQAEAQQQLDADIAKHSNWKNYIDENTLSPSQKTALASFEYNLGPGIWDKSAMNIISMIKSGDLQGASKEIQKYNTVKGTVVKGLTNRRNEEASLLLSGKEKGGQTFDAADTKAFENFDGKTIPTQYSKTPLLQQEFIKKYNEWRANQVNTPIKTGEDILKVQLSDKATEQEKNAIQYGSRMLNSINDLEPLELEYSKLPLKDQLYQEYIPNLLKSDNQKTLEARKKDFITAVLRKESGASIAPSEFANEEKKYFVQPGDSASVIAVKQNARNFAIKAILSAAGKDVNGKFVSSLYNPEAISPQETTNTDISSRIKAIRAKANQQ